MRLLVTGASGLVGRRLLAHAGAGGWEAITALSRRERPPAAGVDWVRGDLRAADAFRARLGPDVVVAHLAAATGAAAAEEMHEVNVEGTRRLLAACAAAGTAGLLYVSSIAARFPAALAYPYAASKRAAEALVRAAALPALVVRPTMVLGPGSPILARLRALAGAPRPLVVGDGRARVQPLGADALAAELARLACTVEERRGETREIGGPEVVSFAELVQRTRAAAGRRPASAVHLPYRPLRTAAAVARRLLGARFPLHPGQLASFVVDGIALPGPAGEPPLATREPFAGLLAEESR